MNMQRKSTVAFRAFSKTKVYEITPDTAMQILVESRNFSTNRNVTPSYVKRYAKDMAADTWKLNGQPIIICEEGYLMDGQHRLEACIQSGHSFRTLVVLASEFGITREEAFHTIDGGLGRRSRHDLQTMQVKNASLVTHSLSWLSALLEWKVGRKNSPTRAENLRLFAEHRLIEDYAAKVNTKRFRQVCVAHAHFAAISYILCELSSDRRKGIEFVEGVISGANLSEGDPRLLLRHKWADLRYSNKKKTGVQDRVTPLVYSIRAWNAFSRGQTVSNFQLPRDGEVPHIRRWANENYGE